MLQRWAVASLLRAKRKFKRVKGYREIPKLIAVLEQKSIDRQEVAAYNMWQRILPTSTKGRDNISEEVER